MLMPLDYSNTQTTTQLNKKKKRERVKKKKRPMKAILRGHWGQMIIRTPEVLAENESSDLSGSAFLF